MAEPSKLHYLNVGPAGTFRASGDAHTTSADVDALIAHLEAEGKDHLVVHVHGGLVSESEGLAIAAKVAPRYQGLGAHPVTLIWESGLYETVRDNLSSLGNTDLFKKLLSLVVDLVSKQIGIGGGKGAGVGIDPAERERELARERPFAELDQTLPEAREQLAELDLDELASEAEAELEAVLDGDEELAALIDLIGQPGEDEATELLRREALTDQPAGGGKGLLSWATLAKTLVSVGIRVVKRMIGKRDHGFYCTVVEELLREVYVADLGAWAWGRMTAKAAAVFAANDGLDGDARHVGRYFLDALAGLASRRPGLVIDLVAHSAGAMLVCEWLRAAAATGAPPVRRVVLLAPALTTKRFHSDVASAPGRYGDLRLFVLDDASERDDSLVPVLYPRSLLYFVSGVLEAGDGDATLVGLERHIQAQGPYRDSHLLDLYRFLDQPGRLVVSPSPNQAARGLRAGARSHDEFNDDPLTLDSVLAFLAPDPAP
ncbi:hypothetical protein [Haliangium sp.]|uniref:hypothetical protein n=1 Tax=Haliangium sp. TaxID=2663208 RepID=UPI003D1048C5